MNDAALTTATYKPLPWQIRAWRDKSPILLFSGGSGSGKSRLGLEKIHALCLKYPGSTGLILRKAMGDVTTKLLPFFENAVLGQQFKTTVHRTGQNHYRYDNGSALFWGGMFGDDQREAVKGIGLDAGLDWVFFDEANAFERADFDVIMSRMRAKAAPWNQIMLATNPDGPLHWINTFLIAGKAARVYTSLHSDNIHNPASYAHSLSLLTGMQYERLVLGKWVMSAGAIYPNFDPNFNVTFEAEYDPSRKLRWGVDDGFSHGSGPGFANYHPAAVVLGQVTPIGGLDIFAEFGGSGLQPSETIAGVRALGYPDPELASVDSSAASFRGMLTREGIYNHAASHNVASGIKLVRNHICDGQNNRLLRIHPRCVNLISEMQSYSYDMRSKKVVAGERSPLKVDDHYVDGTRYLLHGMRHLAK